MKRYFNLTKLSVAALFTFAASFTMSAKLDVSQIVGSYTFSADLEWVDEELAEELELTEDLLSTGVVDVEFASATSVIFRNFVLANSERRVSTQQAENENQIELIAQEITGTYGSGNLYFANENGDFPMSARDVWPGYYLDITLNDDGTLTTEPFTIVQAFYGDNGNSGPCYTIARYTNVVLTPIAEDLGNAHNFQGTYTVKGTLTTYSENNLSSGTTDNNAEFEMIIYTIENEDGTVSTVFGEFAGYTDLPEINKVGYGTSGYVKENVCNLFTGAATLYHNFFDTQADEYYLICVGQPDVTETDGVPTYNNSVYIPLTYDEDADTYTLGDFTVWSRSYSDFTYTILSKWSNLTVTRTGDAEYPEDLAFGETLYVIGQLVDGESDWTTGVEMTQDADAKTYTATGLTLSAKSGFKIFNGEWSNEYEFGGTGDTDIELGQPYFLVQGGSNLTVAGNFLTVVNATVVVNWSDMTVTVTGELQDEIPQNPTLYLIGGNINGEEWTLKTNQLNEEGGVYTLDCATIASGFKINDGSWSGAYNIGSSQKVVVGTETITVENGSNPANITFSDGGTYENVRVTFNLNDMTLWVNYTASLGSIEADEDFEGLVDIVALDGRVIRSQVDKNVVTTLTPGVYILRQGNKAQKVLVK